MNPERLSETKTLRILTILLAISLATVSIFGGFIPGTYERDAASMAAQGMGQDLVDLFLVVPLLLLSFIFFRRGSRVASLIYGGTILYILYAFILFMAEIRKENVESWFAGAPVKLVSGIPIFCGTCVLYPLAQFTGPGPDPQYHPP